MSRLLVVGLVIVIVLLGFNYYTAITRNAETSRELSRIRLELHDGTSRRSEALKKWETCRADVEAARDVSKKLDLEVKKKDELIGDLTKQVHMSRERENNLKKETESLTARLSAAETEAKAERKKLLEDERRKCDMKIKKKVTEKLKTATKQL